MRHCFRIWLSGFRLEKDSRRLAAVARTLAFAFCFVLPDAAAGGADLIDAIKTADNNAVRELLRNHAEVNISQPDGSTALMLAAERNQAEIVSLLIKAGANVNAANEYGATALAVASGSGN